LFTEIADDMKEYLKSLEQRQQKLLDAIEGLTAAGKK
jgi:hypothetical protein